MDLISIFKKIDFFKNNFANFQTDKMKRFSIPADLLQALHFVNGARTPLGHLGGAFEVVEPRNGQPLTKCLPCTGIQIRKIAGMAREAQRKWAATPWIDRRQILYRAGHLLRKHVNEIGEWEVRDNGKPITEAKADVLSCADTFEYFAGVNLAGEHLPYDGERSGRFAYTRREPFGVVGAIGAWNYPIQTASWKIAPAIACGNAILYKPSPLAPISSVLLASLLQCAGLPDGVVNIVQGDGHTGAAICTEPLIKKVSFTGSLKTGKAIARACAAEKLKPCTLELGGKSACIIFADANLEMAVNGALLANFLSQGQVCTNASKVLVHRSLVDQFTQMLIHKTENMRIGDPLNESTHVGACISQQHMERVQEHIQGAVDKGAHLLTGGKRVNTLGLEGGYYLSPCILSNVTPQMAVYREEIFGPVLLIIPFDDDEEALSMANDTEFGLAAGIFTRNLQRAHSMAARLQAGNVYINSYNDVHPNVPFGGFNQSGYGRENGEAAVWNYTQLKAVFTNATEQLDSPFEDQKSTSEEQTGTSSSSSSSVLVMEGLSLPYAQFDTILSDLDERDLEAIGGGENDDDVKHLSEGSFPDVFPVPPIKGKIYGPNSRLMVPLVCQRFGRPESRAVNVWFVVDTASPFTSLSRRTLEAIYGDEGINPIVVGELTLCSMAIQNPRIRIQCRMSKDHFEKVNLLGMDALQGLAWGIGRFDRDDKSFYLFLK